MLVYQRVYYTHYSHYKQYLRIDRKRTKRLAATAAKTLRQKPVVLHSCTTLVNWWIFHGDFFLVGGWATLLKNDGVRQITSSSQLLGKIIQSCSSHHQPVLFCFSPNSSLNPRIIESPWWDPVEIRWNPPDFGVEKMVPSSPTSSPSATAVLGDFLPAQLWAPPLLPAGRKAGDFWLKNHGQRKITSKCGELFTVFDEMEVSSCFCLCCYIRTKAKIGWFQVEYWLQKCSGRI